MGGEALVEIDGTSIGGLPDGLKCGCILGVIGLTNHFGHTDISPQGSVDGGFVDESTIFQWTVLCFVNVHETHFNMGNIIDEEECQQIGYIHGAVGRGSVPVRRRRVISTMVR